MKYSNLNCASNWSERFTGRLLSTSLVMGLAAWSFGQSVHGVSGAGPAMMPLPGSVHGTVHLGDAGPIVGSQAIQFAVVFNIDTAGLQKLVDQVSNPSSPSYRQFLTPAQIGQQFGASQADVDATVSFLQSQGFTVTMVPKNLSAVFATGTASQIQKAFETTLTNVTRESDGSVFHTNLTPLFVPSALVGKIHSIRGVDNARRMQKRATTTLLNPTLYRPGYNADTAYNGGYYGQGVNIAIANWDGFRLDNLPVYYAYYGLPLPAGVSPYVFPSSGPLPNPTAAQMLSNVTVKVVGGGAGIGPTTPMGEGDLDQQNVLQSAPLCNLYVYDDKPSDSAEPLDTYTQIAEDNIADIVTESYGWGSYELEYQYVKSTSSYNIAASYFGSEATEDHAQHLIMSAQGITYMAASGDTGTSAFTHVFTPSGTSTRVTAKACYAYPDMDPEVLMVGGSVLTVNTPSGTRVSEASWGLNGNGGTGGFDIYDSPTWDTPSAPAAGNFSYITYDTPANAFTFNAAPTYQTTYIPQFTDLYNYRLLPDVASHAGGQAGLGTNAGAGWAYTIFFNEGNSSYPLGTGIYIDGTSCASPAVAGSLGVVEQRLFLNRVPNADRTNVRLGRIADLLYKMGGNGKVFNDITTGLSVGTIPGTTVTTNPAAGWDFATGWGSLNFNGLYLSFLGGKG
jgi:subtilase family serine protease